MCKSCVELCLRNICEVLSGSGCVGQFKSHRLHHTDKTTWRQGYIHRRINLTLMFGRNNWKQYAE